MIVASTSLVIKPLPWLMKHTLGVGGGDQTQTSPSGSASDDQTHASHQLLHHTHTPAHTRGDPRHSPRLLGNSLQDSY